VSGRWSGATVYHIIDEFHPGPAWFDLSGSRSGVAIVLEQSGGHCEPRAHLDTPLKGAASRDGHAVFVPGGMTVWRYSEQIQRVRDVRLDFDCEGLDTWLPEPATRWADSEPTLLRYDEPVVQCARLLANECGPDATGLRLYGEGLIASLTALLFGLVQPQADRPIGGLSPPQLKRVLEFFHERLASNVSLEDVAQLTGLSQSQFARAFRASTGISPYRWFLNARVKRAQSWLLRRTLNIAQVAVEVGFADQSHFTKAFRRATGMTPREWQRRIGLPRHSIHNEEMAKARSQALPIESKYAVP